MLKLNIKNTSIEITDEQADELIAKYGKKESKGGYFEPKEGEKFYYISELSNPNWNFWCIDFINLLCIGNCFPTEALAQKHIDKLKAIQKVKKFIADNNLNTDIDWSDNTQTKFFMYYDYDSKILRSTYNQWIKYQSTIPYLAKEEDAETLIRECKEELLLILEVE